jgi:hypothetical protein
MVVAKIRERLRVSKQIMQKFCMERFSLKKLNEVDSKEQDQVEISNRFAAFENSDDGVDINRALETIRENIKISAKEGLGYYKLKKDKPWFDAGCSKLLYQRKQAKLQWLQDSSQINGVSLNDVRCEASRNFRKKRREYQKDKINELAAHNKNKKTRDLYGGKNEFKKGYQP